jgi:hypothetical protein
MSIKPQESKLTVIVRTKENSKCLDVMENESNAIDYVQLAKQVNPDLQVEHFENCTNLKVRGGRLLFPSADRHQSSSVGTTTHQELR